MRCYAVVGQSSCSAELRFSAAIVDVAASSVGVADSSAVDAVASAGVADPLVAFVAIAHVAASADAADLPVAFVAIAHVAASAGVADLPVAFVAVVDAVASSVVFVHLTVASAALHYRSACHFDC